MYWLSRLPAHGFYLTDLFPGLMIMAFGLGGVFVGVQTAAKAGVPSSLAGLAGAMINASFQVGAALGLAIFSALATARTHSLLAAHAARDVALTAGFHRALLAGSIFVAAAAVIGLRAANTRGEIAAEAPAGPGAGRSAGRGERDRDGAGGPQVNIEIPLTYRLVRVSVRASSAGQGRRSAGQEERWWSHPRARRWRCRS